MTNGTPLHYKLAGYGTVAAYAKSLGREEHASRLAEYADRDKSLDAELSELGIRSLNPQASAEGRVRDATGSARPDVPPTHCRRFGRRAARTRSSPADRVPSR